MKVEVKISSSQPLGRIWLSLTNEEHLGKWWNKGTILEPKLGGRFLEPWTDGNSGAQLASGQVVSVIVNSLIEFTWREQFWDSGQETLCKFILHDLGGERTVTVVHSGWESFPDKSREAYLKGFSQGWNELLEKLKAHLENPEV